MHRAGEIGIRQVAARQIQPGQVAEGENRARPAHAARIQHFMAGGGGATSFWVSLAKPVCRALVMAKCSLVKAFSPRILAPCGR